MSKVIGVEEAARLVPDGARIAFGGGGGLMRRPMAFSYALAQTGVKDLDVFQFLATLETDLLIGARAVRSTNCTYVGLLEFGPAPNFNRIVSSGDLIVNEYSEYMFIATLRAADMNIPFLPWKTPWKSDLANNLGIKMVEDPYSGAEYLAVKANPLDFAVIHCQRADEDGYVEAAAEPDLIWDYDHLIGRVAKTTIVCAEEVAPISDPARVALMGAEVSHVIEAPNGAWPAGIHPLYEPDVEHVQSVYTPAAVDDESFRKYIEEHGGKHG
jgi:glutaconate CoA-transferase subunit A